MLRQAKSFRLTASQILAWVMVFAVSLLWQPRVQPSTSGAQAPEVMLSGQSSLSKDKGQGPRGTYVTRKVADDRHPVTHWGSTPPPLAHLHDWHPRVQILQSFTPLAGGLPSAAELPEPRAPPAPMERDHQTA